MSADGSSGVPHLSHKCPTMWETEIPLSSLIRYKLQICMALREIVQKVQPPLPKNLQDLLSASPFFYLVFEKLYPLLALVFLTFPLFPVIVVCCHFTPFPKQNGSKMVAKYTASKRKIKSVMSPTNYLCSTPHPYPCDYKGRGMSIGRSSRHLRA